MQTTTTEKRKPSDATLKQYASRIAILDQAKVEVGTIKSITDFFEKGTHGTSSRKLYLSAIKYTHPTMWTPAHQTLLTHLYQTQNIADKEQKLTPNQEKSYLDFDEIMDVQKHLAENHETDADFLKYVIVSLYTLTAPVRLDYGDMKVFERYRKGRKGNELILTTRKPPVFVMRQYKTSKTYGEVILPIPKALVDVIREWFDRLGAVPKFLLGKEYTPAQLSEKVQAIFKEYTGKEVGVSLLRHAYITKVYPTLTTIKQKDDLARRMLHSAALQEQYNLPTA